MTKEGGLLGAAAGAGSLGEDLGAKLLLDAARAAVLLVPVIGL